MNVLAKTNLASCNCSGITTSTVRDICTFAVLCSVTRPSALLAVLQGGILSRVEPLGRALDRATANVYLEVLDFRCYLHVASWILTPP